MPLTFAQRRGNAVNYVRDTFVAVAIPGAPASLAYVIAAAHDDLSDRIEALLTNDANADCTPTIVAWFSENFAELGPLVGDAAMLTLAQGVGAGAAAFAAMARS